MTLRKWMLAGMMSMTLMGGIAPAYAQRGPDGPARGSDRAGGPAIDRPQRGPDGAGGQRGQWRQPEPGRNAFPQGRSDRRGGRPDRVDRAPERGGNWGRDGREGRPAWQGGRDETRWRGAERGDWRRDTRQDWRGGDGRWNAARRFDDRTRWANQRRWDNGWRQDSRYGWRDYRAIHGDRFRVGRYYAPRGWDYGYQRLSVGILLSSMLYSNDYWLNDPWSYRLPAAYGALQWVRYYDDALLVDTRDGYVADVIHDFFW